MYTQAFLNFFASFVSSVTTHAIHNRRRFTIRLDVNRNEKGNLERVAEATRGGGGGGGGETARAERKRVSRRAFRASDVVSSFLCFASLILLCRNGAVNLYANLAHLCTRKIEARADEKRNWNGNGSLDMPRLCVLLVDARRATLNKKLSLLPLSCPEHTRKFEETSNSSFRFFLSIQRNSSTYSIFSLPLLLLLIESRATTRANAPEFIPLDMAHVYYRARLFGFRCTITTLRNNRVSTETTRRRDTTDFFFCPPLNYFVIHSVV